MTNEAFPTNDPNQAAITAPVTQEVPGATADSQSLVRSVTLDLAPNAINPSNTTVTSEGFVTHDLGDRTVTSGREKGGAMTSQFHEKPVTPMATLSAEDQAYHNRGERRIRKEAEKYAGHTGSGKGEASRRADHIYNTVRSYSPEEIIARGKIPTRKVAGSAIKGFFGR